MILYLASSNPGKLREFRKAARVRNISVETLPGFRDLPPCIEDGTTYEENARKKAIHYSRHAEGFVFADDSGISVDALGGAPGVHSARFAGPDADDEANNRKLLRELRRMEKTAVGKARGAVPPSRAAQYVCVIALAERGTVLTTVDGRAQGRILDSPRGMGGFGYDPLFFYPPVGKTFAELGPDEKFEVSHRGQAFRKLLESLMRRGTE